MICPAWRDRLVTARMSSSEMSGPLDGGVSKRVSRPVSQMTGVSSLTATSSGRASTTAMEVA